MRWTSIGHFLKINKLLLVSFINSKNSRLLTVFQDFLQRQSSRKPDLSWNFFSCEPSKYSSPNKLLSGKIDLKKLI